MALFQRYKKEGSFFVSQLYRKILAGGGSKNPKKLLLEHGVDIDSRKFWQGGFGTMLASKLQNCKHYFEINKVGPTTTHWLPACPPNGLKFDVNLTSFVCDLNV